MNDNCMLAFLNAMKENNTKEWMSANKSWQKEANADFEKLLCRILSELSAAGCPMSGGHDVKDFIMRYARDTRFSHDKRFLSVVNNKTLLFGIFGKAEAAFPRAKKVFPKQLTIV